MLNYASYSYSDSAEDVEAEVALATVAALASTSTLKVASSSEDIRISALGIGTGDLNLRLKIPSPYRLKVSNLMVGRLGNYWGLFFKGFQNLKNQGGFFEKPKKPVFFGFSENPDRIPG